MERETPAVVEIERDTRQRAFALFIEEVGVVDTYADERGEGAGVGEVVLQREGRRQVLDLANLTGTGQIHVMLEGQRSQKLDTDVLGEEIFQGDRRAECAIGADAAHGGRRGAVRLDPAETEAEQEITFFLSEGGNCCRSKQRRKGEGVNVFHGLSTLVLTRGGMRPSDSENIDMGQIARRPQGCGKYATTVPRRGARSCV